MVVYLLNQFILLMLVFIRMTGLVLSAPVLSHRLVPMQVRILLALALAVLILPVVAVPLPQVNNILEFAVMVASELGVGFVLGLGMMVMIQGMQLAGDIISRMAGLGIGDVYDPTSDSELSGFSQFLFILGTVVFLVTGGEKALLSGILESYAVLKPGVLFSVSDATTLLLDCVTFSFVLAVRVAAPAMAALLTVTLVLGLISRTLPQLNLLMLGFGLNGMAALGTLLLSIGFIVMIFEQDLANTFQRVFPWAAGF
ncbi:MAG: hypothetical protein KatS3mg112_1041 [Thermogutta sp.]|nr:MAG: hypothetical protein KatS3mg112_1041 [Thermogutta sp.]